MKGFSVRAFASYGGAVFFQKAVGFILVPLIARNVAVNEFGQINQLLNGVGFFKFLLNIGLDEAIARKSFKSERKSILCITECSNSDKH